ncbi:chemotaxis protein CheX [Chitinispirillales bacterium ANBcel5]|uniref:chemotaxis protein CheX n=1 Tax=Cellulosispirillum alkaliphilum TaxID=3039283 RepID=UPI002A56B1B7|nr:chemotaxis protein CheX [Chitinispirillales bacterium ANBcel5]
MIKQNPIAIDILRELMNMGVGKAANSLNQLFGTHIEFTIPWINFYGGQGILSKWKECEELNTAVEMKFNGDLTGTALLCFKRDDVKKIFNGILSGVAPEDLEITQDSALSEVGNIVINAVTGSISNIAEAQIEYQIPQIVKNFENKQFLSNQTEVICLGANFQFQEQKVNSLIMLSFEEYSLGTMIGELVNKF